MVHKETIEIVDKASGTVTKLTREVKTLGKEMENSILKGTVLGNWLSQLPGKLKEGALGAASLALKTAEFALEASAAKDKMISMFDALGDGKITGEAVDDLLDNMRAKLGVTKDAMVPFAKAFVTLGVTGEEELGRLTQAALSAGAISEGGGEAFVQMFKKIQTAADLGQPLKVPIKGLASLAEMGLNVDDIAKRMSLSTEALGAKLKAGLQPEDARKFGVAMQDALLDKGAKPLATLANSAHNLAKLGLEYLGDLFEDLGKDIAPFMKQVGLLFGIIDSKGQASGKALKEGLAGALKEGFAAATTLMPILRKGLLDVVILGLRAYIALRPIGTSIMAIGAAALATAEYMENLAHQFVESETAMKGTATIMQLIAGAAILIGAAIGVAIAAVGALVGGFIALNAVAYDVGVAIGNFVKDTFVALSEWVTGARDTAANFVRGLAEGITNGAGLVVDAAKNLGTSAINSVKGALGIASPSKVMIEAGQFTGQGFAQGMQATVPDVHGAASGMSAVASRAAAAPAAAPEAAAGGKGGLTVVVEPGAIVIQGGGGATATDLTEQAVSLMFERVAMASGLVAA